MQIKSGQPSLSGGEVSASVEARYDVAKRAVSLKRARNTLGLPQGGQYSRAGWEFGDKTPNSAKKTRLVPFVFASDQAYALEFSEGLMRVFYRNGLVLRPRLTITGISKASQAVVTVPAHDYVVGMTLVFQGVEGMTEINGLRAKVVSVTDANTVVVDLDTTDFSTFTGDTGGVAGDAEGGTGGYPEPPPEGQDPPPVEVPDDPAPPPKLPRPPYPIDDIHYLEP